MVKTYPIPNKPALLLEEESRYLIISDLHIGFEISMISNDINLKPEGIIQELHEDLDFLIKSTNPDHLLLLGDIKSGISSITKIEWDAVPMFFEIGKKIDTIVVPGNHDGNLSRLIPNYITMSSPGGLIIGDVLLTHGHVMPTENFSQANKIIMGHLHPIFFQEGSVLDGQRLWISIKTDKNRLFPSSRGQLEIIIVPSFNRYFYATSKRQNKKSISPIIDRVKSNCSAKIVTLDGSIIGDESILNEMI